MNKKIHLIPVEKIKINPEEKRGEIPKLKKFISLIKVNHISELPPIIVRHDTSSQTDFIVVDGRTRYIIAKSRGWKEIYAIIENVESNDEKIEGGYTQAEDNQGIGRREIIPVIGAIPFVLGGAANFRERKEKEINEKDIQLIRNMIVKAIEVEKSNIYKNNRSKTNNDNLTGESDVTIFSR